MPIAAPEVEYLAKRIRERGLLGLREEIAEELGKFGIKADPYRYEDLFRALHELYMKIEAGELPEHPAWDIYIELLSLLDFVLYLETELAKGTQLNNAIRRYLGLE